METQDGFIAETALFLAPALRNTPSVFVHSVSLLLPFLGLLSTRYAVIKSHDLLSCREENTTDPAR